MNDTLDALETAESNEDNTMVLVDNSFIDHSIMIVQESEISPDDLPFFDES